jgi:nucleoid DNA-binding protein
MTETTEGLSAALAQQAAETLAHLAQQKTFANAIKDFQSQLTRDLEEERHIARGVFGTFAGEVQSEWHAVFNNIFGGAYKMATKVDSLNHVSSKSPSHTTASH